MISLIKKYREMILQLLFSFDMGCSNEEDLIPFLMHVLAISRKHALAAYKKARAIWEQHELLDQKIAEISKDWVLEPIERNVLRLALYEVLIEKETLPQIIITEAIRLCRKFSTPKVGGYVNAILDIYYPNTNAIIHDERFTFPLPERETTQ